MSLFCPVKMLKIESLSSMYMQMEDVRFKLRISQNRKWADKNVSKQIILLDKKLHETTNLWIEIINSK